MRLKTNIIKICIAIVVVIAFNYIANLFYQRFDITQDQRYTLAEASKQPLQGITEPIYIDVYLGGDLPSEFKRLQIETIQILEEYANVNENLVISFIDPKELNDDLNVIITEMQKFGMPPARVDIKENGKTSQEIVFPWAVINHNKKVAKVSLLKTRIGANNSLERINNSVQHLEYAFADAFKSVTQPKSKKIGYLIGNDELESIYVYDFLKNTLDKNYHVIPFALDSANTKPVKTLKELQEFDMTIMAKPQKVFTDHEKYVLDQFTVNGGKSLWLIDNVNAEMDSIQQRGTTLALGRDLNLKDMFFQYGFRVNPVLVKDMYASDIVLLDNNSQANRYPWFYNPLVIPNIKHEIVNNINAVKFEFANTIDLVKQGIDIKKTPLLVSSQLSATVGMPKKISLDEIDITKRPDVKKFNKQYLVLSALLEGQFTSAFKDRVKPFDYNGHQDQNAAGKIVIVADGDLIKNQLDRGQPMELGYDKWTGVNYGNKEFLLNAVNYLLDDTGLLKIRNKEVKIPFLDVERIPNEKQKWQLINILLPLLLLTVFGVLYFYIRKKKYH